MIDVQSSARITPPSIQVVAHSAERRRAMPEAVGAKPAYLTNASVAQLVEAAGLDPAQCEFESRQMHHSPPWRK